MVFIKDCIDSGDNPLDIKRGEYRYGIFGTRITKSKVKKVLNAMQKDGVKNKSIDEFINFVSKAMEEGKTKIYFMKNHWEARY